MWRIYFLLDYQVEALTWSAFLEEKEVKASYKKAIYFVDAERAMGKTIYPTEAKVLNALSSCEFANVKVIIIGQDPYHGEHQAHGLSFSVQAGIKTPPSLANIYKELQHEYPEFEIPEHGCLQSWATQGVLLLNSVLTVEAGKAHSHAKCGWEDFTDNIVQYLDRHLDGLVFMLWGSHAQKKGKAINTQRHLVLKAPHPSPLSAYRGFFGCGHFKEANQWLIDSGKKPISWRPVL